MGKKKHKIWETKIYKEQRLRGQKKEEEEEEEKEKERAALDMSQPWAGTHSDMALVGQAKKIDY